MTGDRYRELRIAVPPRTPPEDLVLLDFGSTAIRLIHARIRHGRGFRIVREQRVPSRLASATMTALRPTAVRSALASVERFLKTADRPGARVLAIGAAAVRNASNAELLHSALRQHRIRLRVLSGEMESRLSARAALYGTHVASALVADLGGGSLELIRATDRRMHFLASLPLGAIRLTARFLPHDPPHAEELTSLRSEVCRQLVPVLKAVEMCPMVGVGGTFRTLAKIIARDGQRDGRRRVAWLDADSVHALRARFERLPIRERCRIPGLRRDRADIIVAGALVVEELMAIAGVRRVRVSPYGLRHGVLLRETFGSAGSEAP